MQSANKVFKYVDPSFDGGGVFTETELYTLQAAAYCAITYWTKNADEATTPAVKALALDQVKVHTKLHKGITKLLEEE